MKFLNIQEPASEFIFNNMRVKSFSFFNRKSRVGVEIANYQFLVFKHYNLPINIYDHDCRHPKFINTILEKENADIYIFFDIDAIPLSDTVFEKILNIVDSKNVFGVAQQDNTNNLGHIYAAPSCLCFTKDVYERLGKPSFVERQRYLLNSKIDHCKKIIKKNKNKFNNEDYFYKNIPKLVKKIGGKVICDVAEEFTYLCEENDINVNLWFPTDSLNQLWNLNGYGKYGHGTTYNELIYHQFQIRDKSQKTYFIKKCNDVISN